MVRHRSAFGELELFAAVGIPRAVVWIFGVLVSPEGVVIAPSSTESLFSCRLCS